MLELQPRLFDALDTPDGLRGALQQAVMLEHATIPTYLYALYSLKPGSNGEIRQLIASVVIEEMSHMALACNLLNAIGGSPVIDDPAFIPRYPGPLPGGVEAQLTVPLQEFSPKLVHDVFMEIEEPERPLEFEVLEAVAPPRTIGQFYAAIDTQIGVLGDAIFTGNPARQVTSDFASSDVIAITDARSASAAIETIVEQGEGSSQSPLGDENELAHYYRFAEIYHGKRLVENPNASPGAKPHERYVYGGEPIPFDASGVFPVVANPRLADYPSESQARYACNAFNYTYTSLLQVLDGTFNCDPARLGNAIGLMESLKQQAMDLVTIELADGSHAGPSFEYQPVSA